MSTTLTIETIAKWINESVPATCVDGLIDHVNQAKLETNETYEIGEQLVDAISEA